jgi:hypothetical protein
VVDQAELSQKRAYTCIGLYRGNIVAIKPLYKRSIDITRNIRKELKQVRFMYYVVFTSILELSHTLFTRIFYTSVKVFNRLPTKIKKEFDNSKKCRHSLKIFLREKSFYSLQEYFEL